MTYVDKALSKKEDAIGIGRKGTIDRPYKLHAPFWTVDTLFYAVPRADVDIEFALGCFLRINWKAKDESTGLPSLPKNTISETRVLIPDAYEQRRIGAFFQQLDHLITLHQRKRNSRQKGHPNEKAPEIKCIRKARRIGLFWVLAEASHRYCLNIVSRLSKHRSLFILCLHNVEERLFYLMPLS